MEVLKYVLMAAIALLALRCFVVVRKLNAEIKAENEHAAANPDQERPPQTGKDSLRGRRNSYALNGVLLFLSFLYFLYATP